MDMGSSGGGTVARARCGFSENVSGASSTLCSASAADSWSSASAPAAARARTTQSQTRQHALTVFVAQTRLDAELAVKVFGDAVVLCAQGLLLVEIAHHILQMIHSCSFLFSGLYLTKFKYPFRLQEGYFSVKVRFVNKKKTKFSGCDVGVIHRFYSS